MKVELNKKLDGMVSNLIKNSMLQYNKRNYQGDTRKEMTDLIQTLKKDFMKQLRVIAK